MNVFYNHSSLQICCVLTVAGRPTEITFIICRLIDNSFVMSSQPFERNELLISQNEEELSLCLWLFSSPKGYVL